MPPKTVSFTPSQTGTSSGEVPLAWTANPFRLLVSDMQLCLAKLPLAAFIFWPLPSHPTDELYPTWKNMQTLAVHAFLIIYQLLYLLSIPLALLFQVPSPLLLIFLAAGLAFNHLVCKTLLNGPSRYLNSQVDLSSHPSHPSEQWIFCNGVAVGHHWLQANLDRLALTFRRPVRGILNETNGCVFDLLQCLVERNFAYATNDVRAAYRQIKDALLKEGNEKVVLILHSQGGIQGSLVVDWLLDEFPHSTLSKLEIFTFGNAANHFNNPLRDVAPPTPSSATSPTASFTSTNKPSTTPLSSAANGDTTSTPKHALAKAIAYIEHYGNDRDFVARWGVFHYTSIRNRYMGRIFRAPASGHLLNQHYLDGMFALDKTGMKVAEGNAFMDAAVDLDALESGDGEGDGGSGGDEDVHEAGDGDVKSTQAGKAKPKREKRESLSSSCRSAISPSALLKNFSLPFGFPNPLDEIALPFSFDGISGSATTNGAAETPDAVVEDVNSPVKRVVKRKSGTLRVKDFSRLWGYRDGRCPGE